MAKDYSRDQALELLNQGGYGNAASAGGLLSTVKSLATWPILYGVVHGGIKGGAKAAMKSLAKIPVAGVKRTATNSVWNTLLSSKTLKRAQGAAAAASKEDHSIASFIINYGQTGKNPGTLGSLRTALKGVHEASTGSAYKEYLGSRGSMTIGERARRVLPVGYKNGKMTWSGADSKEIFQGMAAGYAKETAFGLPFFYALDRNFGNMGDTAASRQKEPIPWYNIPKRAADFASYSAEYFAGDLIFRGMLAPLAKGIKSSLMKPNKSRNTEAWAPSLLNHSVKAMGWWERNKPGPMIDTARAHAVALKAAYEARDRTIFHDRGTLSKLRSGRKPDRKSFYEVYQSKIDDAKAQVKLRKSGTESIANTHFSRLMGMVSHIREDTKEGSLRLFNAAIKGGEGAEAYRANIVQNLYEAKGVSAKDASLTTSERFIMKLLGVRRATLGDYNKTTRDVVYGKAQSFVNDIKRTVDDIELDNVLDKELFPKARKEFNRLLAEKHIYVSDKHPGKILDMRKLSPMGMADRALQAVSNMHSIGPLVANLFPFRSIMGKDLDPIIGVEGIIPIMGSKSALTQEGMKSDFWLGTAAGHRQAFDFSKGGTDTMGMMVRNPSSSKGSYTLYSLNQTTEEIVPLAKDVRPLMAGFSEKSHRVIYGIAGFIDPISEKHQKFGSGPGGKLRKWMYDKTNWGGGTGTGLSPSIFEQVADLLRPRDASRPHVSLNAKQSVLGTKGFDLNNTADMDAATKRLVIEEMVGARQVIRGIETEAYDKVFLKDRDVFKQLITDRKGRLLNIDGEDVSQWVTGWDVNNPIGVDDFVDLVMSDALQAKRVVRTLIAKSKGGKLEDAVAQHHLTKHIKERVLDMPDSLLVTGHQGEHPHQKLLRYIADMNMTGIEHAANAGKYDPLERALDVVRRKSIDYSGRERLGYQFSRKEHAVAEMAVKGREWNDDLADQAIDLAYDIKGKDVTLTADMIEAAKGIQNLQQHDVTKEYLTTVSRFKRFSSERLSRQSQLATMRKATSDSPYALISNDAVTWGKFGGQYAYETFGTLMDVIGAGWDRGKYTRFFPSLDRGPDRKKSITGLFARRAAVAAGLTMGYDAIDTFADLFPVFNGTALDEGLTVAAADQTVRARLAAAKVYDIAGVTGAAKYMEGLMPKSMSTLPGAALGFAAYGVPGAIAGAVLNRWLQPQLAEGPLSFLSAIPVIGLAAAPFVNDMTKDYEELQDLYTGRDPVPWRKGAGWTLGTTPIEGGRVEALVPNWYARLKSQVPASEVLYGSKLEQFIFKDRWLVDFSIGDLVDPQYLTRKHYFDRPYMEPDVPFSEVPVLGPLLGHTLGRMYNWIHPNGTNSLMHLEEARQQMTSGVSGTGMGGHQSGSLSGFGDFTGINGSFNNGTQVLPGAGMVSNEYINRTQSMRFLASEQIYRGIIEPPGLAGFTSSQLLWGGNEPFIDESFLATAGEMDSTSRAMWDQNLGDLLLLNEGVRRLYPRPRTSYDKQNPIPNQMPTWMPEEYRTGDPYCVTPETEVETIKGLRKAEDIKRGDLIRTVRGRYMPVGDIIPREIDEEIYVIKLKESDTELRVTSEHPLLRSNITFAPASELKKGDTLAYPLRDLRTCEPYFVPKTGRQKDHAVYLAGGMATILGILLKYATMGDEGWLVVDRECPYTTSYLQHLFDTQLNAHMYNNMTVKSYSVIELWEYLNEYGLPDEFFVAGPSAVVQFMRPFVVNNSEFILRFDFPSRDIAYQVWSHLAQVRLVGELKGTTVQFTSNTANVIHYLMYNETNSSFIPSQDDIDKRIKTEMYTDIASRHFITVHVEAIRLEHYVGTVYGFEIDSDDTFCTAHVCTHNTKKPYGEYILPGSGYEASHDVTVDFPTGASRLGYSAHDQALSMIGLGAIDDEETLEILAGGTAIHRMVQMAMKAQNSRIKTEALITDTENRIASYVDIVVPTFSGVDMPVEIKSINAAGFDSLKAPKRKNVEQLNAYMHMMNSPRGQIIYVDRDDPSRVKSFNTHHSADMYNETINRLHAARAMAKGYLEEGYGNASAGYSYTDRFEVLLNAAPFSKEFREVSQLVTEQIQAGQVAEDQIDRLKKLKKYTTGVLGRHEMYENRFSGTLFDPETTYNSYNMNDEIKAAAEYSLPERAIGAAWEKLTSYRSFLHTKLFGVYTPEQTYENEVLYGKGFQSWGAPIEGLIKPWARTSLASTGPVQGAMAGIVPGMLAGGPFGATVGAIGGAIYGTAHGAYRAMTGSEYIPDNFQQMSEYSEYFDAVQYDRASRMLNLTGDNRYLTEMAKTSIGYGIFDLEPETIGQHSRSAYQAASIMDHPNTGHQSPWGGQDTIEDLDFTTEFNLGQSFAAMPYYDRPFFKAFLNVKDPDERERLLKKTDISMARVLSRAWGQGSARFSFDPEEYFKTMKRPNMADAIMHPNADMDLFEMRTLNQDGKDAHDFGLGWRDQVKKAERSLVQPLAIDIHNPSSAKASRSADAGDIQNSVAQQLLMAGLDFKLQGSDTPSIRGNDAIRLNITIQRDASIDIANKSRG